MMELWSPENALVLLLSLYTQPTFHTRNIIHPASLLVPTCKRIICQQHWSIQVDIAKTTQTSHKVHGGARRQARLHHGTYHELRVCSSTDSCNIHCLNKSTFHKFDIHDIGCSHRDQM